jgi:hypothetical protein
VGLPRLVLGTGAWAIVRAVAFVVACALALAAPVALF